MSQYKHILVALELTPETDKTIIEKVKALVENPETKITLIHVIEHLVNFGGSYSMPAGIDIEHELTQAAQEGLQDIGEQLHVPISEQIVKGGAAKHVIIDEAKRKRVDLIVVGSHGRHGVRLLLGSTANAILHGAHCDVLAVRVK